MTTRTRSALAIAAVVAVGVTIGIARAAHDRATAGRRAPVAVIPTTAPVAGEQTFADPVGGIAVCYPSSWRKIVGKTAELTVAAPAGRALLALDVPAMSHPFIIPIGLVASGYLDEVRKSQVPDAVVVESTDLTVNGATARRVTTRGHAAADGSICVDTAVLMVHHRQVYILSCDSDPAAVPTARAALDAAVASVQWTK